MNNDMRDAILDLWASGSFDTYDISVATKVPEFMVHRIISNHREASRSLRSEPVSFGKRGMADIG